MTDNRAIGVFDSGLGGLSAVRELKHVLPNENIIYFGDTGRVPYGTRSLETLHRYTKEDIEFLKKHDVKMIVAACGTVSSTITDEMIEAAGVPFLGVVKPTAKVAVENSKSGKIGVLGTGATVKSGAFEREIKKLNSKAQVVSKACPLFVPLVENGLVSGEITEAVAKMYLSDIGDVDTLILGCTHFPLLSDVIQKILPNVTLIDSGKATAEAVREILTQNNIKAENNGECRYFVSDSAEDFSRLSSLFLGESDVGEVKRIEIE